MIRYKLCTSSYWFTICLYVELNVGKSTCIFSISRFTLSWCSCADWVFLSVVIQFTYCRWLDFDFLSVVVSLVCSRCLYSNFLLLVVRLICNDWNRVNSLLLGEYVVVGNPGALVEIDVELSYYWCPKKVTSIIYTTMNFLLFRL